jgi:hypothetical protein
MKRTLLIALLVLSSVVLLSFILLRKPHQVDTNTATLSTVQNFHKVTFARWGSGLIDVTHTNQIGAFVANQEIDFAGAEGVPISDIQRAALDTLIMDFLGAYSHNTFEALLKFHSRAPYKIDTTELDGSEDVQKDLRYEGITLPVAPVERLRSYWMLYNRYKLRYHFLEEYLAHMKKQGEALPRNQNEEAELENKHIFPEYLRELSVITSSNPPVRVVRISTNELQICFVVTQTRPTPRELFTYNKRLPGGILMSSESMFRYDETPESIAQKNGRCMYAVVTLIIATNFRPGLVPITLAVYWSPLHQTWLPDSFATHSMIGATFIF